MTDLRDTLTALASLDLRSLRNELDRLVAIREWAMDQIGVDYKVGDRVIITDLNVSRVDPTHGWYPYREALALGQGGTVEEITFNTHSKRWVTCVAMTHTWSVHEQGWGLNTKQVRYWNGPADETPDGYTPPLTPNGKTKHFYISADSISKDNAWTASSTSSTTSSPSTPDTSSASTASSNTP
ncbi:hypothetical protein ACIA7S_28670 [Streptomyces sp. NPDC051643]|uniref:hypothetical protein n=1 Tax=Streptomyces sp. NPDC051643 TaxID=3365665 RepID=UPI0037B5A548